MPSPFDKVPADLAAVLVLTVVATTFAFVPGLGTSPLRVVFGLFFVLFAPGYAIVAALFPEVNRREASEASENPWTVSINGVERLALSLAMSIAIVPLLGLILNFSTIPFRTGPVISVLGGLTVVSSLVAIRRRLSITDTRRFRVPYSRWLRSARNTLAVDSPTDVAVVLLVVISVLIAGVSLGQTVTPPQNAEMYTELYVLSGTNDGVGQATNYTTNLSRGEEHSVLVGIGNKEGAAVEYTLVVRVQRMRVQGNLTTPIESEELTRVEVAVPHNQTEERRIPFTPNMTGEQLRIQFLLYQGGAPPEPSSSTAYREIHLWVSVS